MNNKKSPKRQKPLRTFSWVYKDHKTPAELLLKILLVSGMKLNIEQLQIAKLILSILF